MDTVNIFVARFPGVTALEELVKRRDYLIESIKLGCVALSTGANYSVEQVPGVLGGVQVLGLERLPPVIFYGPGQAEEGSHKPPELLREHDRPPARSGRTVKEEKQAILARLKAYRTAHGLGCLDAVARAAGADITVDLLRGLLSGDASLSVADWRRIGKALSQVECSEQEVTPPNG